MYTTVSFVSQEERKCHHSEEHPRLQDYKVILLPYAFPFFFSPFCFFLFFPVSSSFVFCRFLSFSLHFPFLFVASFFLSFALAVRKKYTTCLSSVARLHHRRIAVTLLAAVYFHAGIERRRSRSFRPTKHRLCSLKIRYGLYSLLT